MISPSSFNPVELMYSKEKVDRSEWRKNVLKTNPEINNLCERIYPVNRAIQFGKQYYPGKAEVKQKLDKTVIIQLILQHLSTKGLKQTKQTLEKEARVTTPIVEGSTESRLVTYIRNALKDTERIYDLSMEHTEYTKEERQSKITEREDLLFQMDLLEEENEDDGVNIWDEPAENIITEKVHNTEYDQDDEVVKYGSLNKLVEHLTHDSKHDLQFLKTFLMTYQSFCTPEKLMSKLQQRYNVPQGTDEKSARTIQIRVVNVLKTWIDNYYSDFDDKLIQQLRTFLDQILIKFPGPGSNLMKSLSKVVEKLSPATESKHIFNEKTPEPIVAFKNIFSNNLSFHDIDEEEIARQLTLIEFEIYRKIKPPELLNQSWNKTKLKSRAPNVLKMIDRFNSVSMWVATMIIQTAKVKARARMMARFIKIAEHLKTLNNYNSLMAIIAGLNFSSVYRLKYTREELSPAILKSYAELEKIMNSEGSFKTYRGRLQNFVPPMLPYLGVHLTDLTFMEENPDNIPIEVSKGKSVNLINFTKRTLVFKVISLVQETQNVAYNLQPVHQIQEFLLNIKSDLKADTLDLYQQDLYKESLRREPKRAQRSDIQ
ncbi:aimless RasGEF [Dictyostelium purpureum]|uniref:Aimless RasGEF n=1 Tax=Dictyostelium purpureum TaxID=5786 RepID=F0ZDI2_DICPU|nr:aimless RasGEF [Dictyostelium purpureum]EGC38002.1 aimless RasGEF [Dictyostelium purpureum]|eukprot:XP_003285486.1 aimless RasGEF [Dictyostelium purpureum]